MKKIKSILLAAMLVCVTSLTAASKPSVDITINDQASKEIAELLKSPSFEITKNESASISLIVNDNNELVVLSVKTENQQVEKFVKSRLNYHKLETNLEKGREYKVPLTITSEN